MEMSGTKFIPAQVLFDEWRKDSEFVREYEALEVPFAIIGARVHAGLTQEELAERMGTSQSAIARLESGRSHPSTTTLAKLAAATGTKLRVSFVPDDKAA